MNARCRAHPAGIRVATIIPGNMLTPGAVAYLASDRAQWITGVSPIVDGELPIV